MALLLFLTVTLGAGPAIVGLVEGVAEATASLLKLISGRLADRGWNHKGLVLGGYSTSNLARPLIGDFSQASQRGTAFGLYHMTTGLAALPGALLFGILWQGLGAATAFVVAAAIAAASALVLLGSSGKPVG